MASIKIVECELNKNTLKNFIKFAWNVYRPAGKPGYKYWVPPLISQEVNILRPDKNPFFEHSEAAAFIATRGEIPAGRIVAIWNNNHNIFHDEKVGFFGFFECLNDQDVANALFDKASEWVKSKGGTALRGPANLTLNDECGFLAKGFDSIPFILMPYTPEYYLQLAERAGFKKAQDLYSYYLSKEQMKWEILPRICERMEKRYNLSIVEISKKNFDSAATFVKRIYNKAWSNNWGFVPVTGNEFKKLIKDLKEIYIPKMTFLVYSGEKPIGWSMSIPNYNEIAIKLNGSLFPFGFIKFLLGKKKIKQARVFTLGVLPELQQKGIGAYVMYHCAKSCVESGYMDGEMGWILESNYLMNRGMEQIGATPSKIHRIYERNLTASLRSQ
ncbi:MAG: hypothetical protein A3F16_03085 [Deltaproteobacteria bacterium RIFCSPHIGHO2_12_FULL_43_9]|nr:MAG: hypothetical protein A3F16_03085 [Deltaproteobacteria bacterium RIFCSPHIGHO2_12_FULL_43_9]